MHHAHIHTYPTHPRQQNLPLPNQNTLKLTFSRSLKKEPHNKNLQPSHTNHQPTLHDTKIKYPTLRALNSAEVPVLARAEVFLVAVDGGEVPGDFHDGFFEGGGLFGGGALFGGEEGGGGFVFDLGGRGLVLVDGFC